MNPLTLLLLISSWSVVNSKIWILGANGASCDSACSTYKPSFICCPDSTLGSTYGWPATATDMENLFAITYTSNGASLVSLTFSCSIAAGTIRTDTTLYPDNPNTIGGSSCYFNTNSPSTTCAAPAFTTSYRRFCPCCATPTAAPTYIPTMPTRIPSQSPTLGPTIIPSLKPTASSTITPSMYPSAIPTLGPSVLPSASPSKTPTKSPTVAPTFIPSFVPSTIPTTTIPTFSPSTFPTAIPTYCPSVIPSLTPSVIPTVKPTKKPSSSPTIIPSFFSSTMPSISPTVVPTIVPTTAPTSIPTYIPTTLSPSIRPTVIPSVSSTTIPSFIPTSIIPSVDPTKSPTISPTFEPTITPTMCPSVVPTFGRTVCPSFIPTLLPTIAPTLVPTAVPTIVPSFIPTDLPSMRPTTTPSVIPSFVPTCKPSAIPTRVPSSQPSRLPSSTPSKQPRAFPSTQPSKQPIRYPTHQPKRLPSRQPLSNPTHVPTILPTTQPSMQPTSRPSRNPTSQPIVKPSQQPLARPSLQPFCYPTKQPSRQPLRQPTEQPSKQPSKQPSCQLTMQPTSQPSLQPIIRPSTVPSKQPYYHPSKQPSKQPSQQPNVQPSLQPNVQPSSQPSRQPLVQPSIQPSSQPSTQPLFEPTGQPTWQPLANPSFKPANIPTKQPSRQPSFKPMTNPTYKPSSQPSRRPSIQSSSQPSGQPKKQPSRQPLVQPSGMPTLQPTDKPSQPPTARPSHKPTIQPSFQPSSNPSMQPSYRPNKFPSSLPTIQPSSQPIFVPSIQPTSYPWSKPSRQPSAQPSTQPTAQPIHTPSMTPTQQPTFQPSFRPTFAPTLQPTILPSSQPSSQPSKLPSTLPSCSPSFQPSMLPTMQPFIEPSSQPSTQPSIKPSSLPSSQPNSIPTSQPKFWPSKQPTRKPTTNPSMQPSVQPWHHPSSQPTSQPMMNPSSPPSTQPSSHPSSQPMYQPTLSPTKKPTGQPNIGPTSSPSFQPTKHPTFCPSSKPSVQPLIKPRIQPTRQPSYQPVMVPSRQPSVQPSQRPSRQPSLQPLQQPSSQPFSQPTVQPSCEPSTQPSEQPSRRPSRRPSHQPTKLPSSQPSAQPTIQPSQQPSRQPSAQPSNGPSLQPSSQPSRQPSGQPSAQPTIQPSEQPSRQSSAQPSKGPSLQPSRQPTNQPSSQPSAQPTIKPFQQPSRQPSVQPSKRPSRQPYRRPTNQPSSQPSAQPSMQPKQQPSRQPSAQPFKRPSRQPSSQPTMQPKSMPSFFPSKQPSELPSTQPIMEPSIKPSSQPTLIPTSQPSKKPTIYPSILPTIVPSVQPLSQPSMQPTSQPSSDPSASPTLQPSIQPLSVPSNQPRNTNPTSQPSLQPSSIPSHPSTQPTIGPSSQPTVQTTRQPSSKPSSQPNRRPSKQPSRQPYKLPSSQPTAQPRHKPTFQPYRHPSMQPSILPSGQPSHCPSAKPSSQPRSFPSSYPTYQPIVVPSSKPSTKPIIFPTVQPLSKPTFQPNSMPSTQPLNYPSQKPSVCPSSHPTAQPTRNPALKYFGIPTVNAHIANPITSPTNFSLRNNKVFYNNSLQLSQYVISISNTLQQRHKYTSIEAATYEEVYFNGINVLGSCSAWSSFLYGQILLNQYYYQPSSLDIIFIVSSTANDPPNIAYFTCSERSQIIKILSRLKSFSISALSVYECSSNLWVINTCDSYPRICINCSDPCSSDSSFTISSCWSSFNSIYTITGFILSVGFSVIGSSAPVISFLGYSSTSNSIIVSTGLSKPGLIYCAAYRSNLPQPISVQQVIQQGYGNRSESVVSVFIAGLTPMANYLVYCAAVSLTGSPTSYADMTKRTLSISTKCCKVICVSLSTKSIVLGVGIQNIITMTVNNLPDYYLDMQITLNQSISTAVLVPSVFTLNQSTVMPTTIMASSYNPLLPSGRYYYAIKLWGPSAREYVVQYQSGYYLTVVGESNCSVYDCPKLVSAYFSPDGSYLQASFDSNTNKANIPDQFPCNTLFDFKCSSTSTCVWASSAVVKIYFRSNGNSSCAVPGHLIHLRNNTSIHSQYSRHCKCGSPSASITIGSPVVPLETPNVIISAPTIIDKCSDFIISVAESTGHAGRNWSSFSISVTSANDDDVIQTLQTFLSRSFRIFSPPPISSSYFKSGGKYTFSVTLCNFLNACGMATSNLLVVSSLAATISFPGSSYRNINRYTELWLQPTITPSNCSTKFGSSSFFYSWTVYQNNVRTSTLAKYFTSTSSEIYIPAYTLEVNTLYRIDVAISNPLAPSVSSTASIFLNVVLGGVYAVIQEGLQQTIIGSNTIRFNASQSFDQDVQTLKGVDAGMSFQWTCTQITPSFSASCSSVLSMIVQSPSILLVTGNANLLTQTAQITLTVGNSGGTKAASLIIQVTVSNTTKSTATLVSSSDVGILPHDYFHLIGGINLVAGESCNATWSVSRESEGISLAKIANTPVHTHLPAANSSTDHKLYLVIPPNSLSVYGLLTFTLHCASPFDVSTILSASITVTVNTPPVPGSFYCTPNSGREYSVQFNFIAQYWFDTDLPLTYEFGYFSPANGNNSITLRSRSEFSFAFMYLPAGPSQFNYYLDGNVQVFDSLLSNVTALFPITVTPLTGKVNLSLILKKQKEQTFNKADTALRSISLYTSVVNYVPCDLAPNCTILNRKVCLQTAHTCGKCLQGHFGESFDSNDPCIVSTKYQKPHGDSGRHYSQYHRNLVVDNHKTCPGNCSSHGRCAFRSKDTGIEVDSCRMDESECESVCICDDDYRGTSACYLESGELLQRISYRNNAILSVQTYLQSQHLNVNSLNVIITAMKVATQVTEELSLSACSAGIEILTTVLNSYSQLGLSASLTDKVSVFEIINSLIATLYNQYLNGNLLLGLGNSTKTSLEDYYSVQMNKLLDLLYAYSSLVGKDMVPGNFPVEWISPSCRVRTIISSPSSPLILSPPQSALEVYKKLNMSSVYIPPQAHCNGTAIPLTITSCRAKFFSVFDEQIKSDPVFLYGESETRSTLNKNLLANVTIASAFPYQRIEDEELETFRVTCYAGFYRVINHTCADGSVVHAVCNSSVFGYLEGRCPLSSYHSYCSYVMLSELFTSQSHRSCDSDFDMKGGVATCQCPLIVGVNTLTDPNSNMNLSSNSSRNSSVGHSLSIIAYTIKMSKLTKPYSFTFAVPVEDHIPEIVYYTIGAILLSIILSFCFRRQNKDLKQKFQVQPIKESTEGESDRQSYKTVEEISYQIKQIFELGLPVVFRRVPLKEKTIQELRRHHKLIKLLCPLPISNRMAVIHSISLFSEVLILMFTVSFILSLFDEVDTGQCQRAVTLNDCLRVYSILAPSVPICEWKVDVPSEVELCSYSTATNFALVRVAIAAVAVVISSIVVLFLNRLLNRCTWANGSSLLYSSSSSSRGSRGNIKENDDYDNSTNHIIAASLDDEAAANKLEKWCGANQEAKQPIGDVTVSRRDFNLFNRFFNGDVKRMMKWIASDIHELKYTLKSLNPAAIVDIQVRKRVIFYLEHLILSQRNSALFRAKCERDFHRVVPLSRSQTIIFTTIITVVTVMMLVYVVKFAQSASVAGIYAWISSFILGLLLDLFILETAVVFLLNALCPHIISSDVRRKIRIVAKFSAYANVRGWQMDDHKDEGEKGDCQSFLILQGFENPHRLLYFSPFSFDRLFVSFMRLPILLQDALSYTLIGVSMGLVLLSSVWLFNIFPILALGPWVSMYALGFLFHKMRGQSSSDDGNIALRKSVDGSVSPIEAGAAASEDASQLNRRRKGVKMFSGSSGSSIRDKIFTSNGVLPSPIHRPVGHYNFKYEDYKKKHNKLVGSINYETAVGEPNKNKRHLISKASFQVEEKSSFHSSDINDGDYNAGADEVRSPDNLIVDFLGFYEEEIIQDWQSLLYREPMEGVYPVMRDGVFAYDHYESESEELSNSDTVQK